MTESKKTNQWISWTSYCVAVFGLLGLSAATVQAQSTGGESETTFSNIMKDLDGYYYGRVSGASVNEISDETPSGDPISLYNELGITYNMDANWNVRAIPHWTQPFHTTAPTLDDPSLRFTRGNLIDSSVWSMHSHLEADAPLSSSTRDEGLITRIEFELNPEYSFVNSPFSAGIITRLVGNAYTRSGSRDADTSTYSTILWPQLSYDISNSTGILAEYIFESGATKGNSSITAKQEGNLNVFFNWDVTDKLTLSPFINVPTNKELAFKNTSYNLDIVGTLF